MRTTVLIAVLALCGLVACNSSQQSTKGGRANTAKSSLSPSNRSEMVTQQTIDDGWDQAGGSYRSGSPAALPVPVRSANRPPDHDTDSSKGKSGYTSLPSADAIADAAAQSWAASCPNLPNPADLRLVLRTTLQSLIAPDFDAYHTMLTERGCSLSTAISAECLTFRERNDLGYSDSQWDRLSDVEQAKVYWLAVDARRARWKAVDVSRITTGRGYGHVAPVSQGMVCNFCVYLLPDAPEFFNDCMTDAAPGAHVLIPTILSGGEVPLTFCFGYNEKLNKWYPFCLVIHHGDKGPGCQLRI